MSIQASGILRRDTLGRLYIMASDKNGILVNTLVKDLIKYMVETDSDFVSECTLEVISELGDD